MRAYVRFDDGECSGWFPVEQGLNNGYALALLLLNIFVVVIDIAYARCEADKDFMDALVGPKMKTGASGSNGHIFSPSDVSTGHAIILMML